MKEKVYLRIAKPKSGKCIYRISRNKTLTPIDNGGGKYSPKYYHPTICVGLVIDVDNKLFQEAIAELDLQIKSGEVAADIKVELE